MFKKIGFLIASVLLLATIVSADSIAELPRTSVITTAPVQTGQVITVAAGGNFQAALNVAAPGDTIELQAGATFTGTFAFNNKPFTGQWIVIRSSRYAELAAGRTSPSDASKMAKLIPTDTGQVLDLYPTSNGFTKAHNLRFVGVEIAPNPNYSTNFNLIKLGTNGSWQTSAAQAPEDITFDRCYIHGLTDRDAFRGVNICATRVAFVGCYVSEFHVHGQDAQAILVGNAPGPILIDNCYLEASGENFMSGGLDVRIQGLVPADITITRSTFFKPLAWQGVWTTKNSFELKNAQRVLVEDCVFENNWVDAQSGIAIQFTPRNQDGASPWSAVRDVTFQNNIIRNTPSAFSILGADDIHPSGLAERIVIRGNRIEGLNAPSGGGRFLQVLGGSNIVVQNNSAISVYTVTPVVFDVAPVTGFVFTDNIFSHGDYGVRGSGTGEGASALDYYAPGYVFLRNVLIGGAAYSQFYPTGNYFTN